MLDTSAGVMRDAIEDAIDFRRKHTAESQVMIKRYAGKAYRTDWLLEHENHENLPFEYVSNWLPAMIYDNPKVNVGTSLPGVFDDQIDALEHVMNRWCTVADLVGNLTHIAYRIPFDFGIGMISLDVSPGYEHEAAMPQLTGDPQAPPLRPILTPISALRFFCDPQATMWNRTRFQGHIWIKDREELLAARDLHGRPVYDQAAVRGATSDLGFDEIYGEEDPRRDHHPPTSRDQIIGYETYVPETREILTLAYAMSSGDGRGRGGDKDMIYLREPRKWYGHPRGPYVRFGVYDVPDQLYPLPMLAVTADLIEEVNAHAGQAADDAGTAKRLIAVDSNHKDLMKHIESTENGTVIGIPGLTGQAAQALEFGGPQEANLLFVQFLLDRFNKVTGTTDAKRGEVSGATAFEVGKAEEGTDAKQAFQRRMFHRSVIDVLEHALWYMNESDQVKELVPVEQPIMDPMTGQIQTVEQAFIFIGGPRPGTPHPPFHSLQASIEPYTMEYVDEFVQQRRVLQAVQLTVQELAPAAVNFPFLEIERIADDVFEALNFREGGKRYINFELLGMMQQMAMMGGVGPDGAGGAPGGPPMLEGEVEDPVQEEAAMLAEGSRAA